MSSQAKAVAALCAAIEPLPGEPRELASAHVGRVAPLATASERAAVAAAAVAQLVGLGPLEAHLADPDVDEVMVNGAGDVWVERHGQLRQVGAVTSHELATSIERILAPLGRRLDRVSPIVDARLPDGSRVCAIVAPISVEGTVLTIRRFRRRTLPASAFAGPAGVAAITELVNARCNVIVSGATSSGKTSLLCSVLSQLPDRERVVLVEDTAELAPDATNVVRLEARTSNADGVRAIPLDELVRTALRLRPDRLIVGEARGAEVVALVQALNTGHDGSWSTCHANSAHDALIRLESLILQAAPGWPLAAIRHHLYRSIDVVVHTRRAEDGRRQVTEIAEVVRDSREPLVRQLLVEDRIVGLLDRRRA
ncbi:MAG: Flp pilus assembly complex ATPase component TadA [Actinomycetota bacterium]|nr:Flp pilus assembly complex ATPase component TadA [Actinomycetota bacterium]